MKIGIVCYPTYGGSGVLATELGKALAKKGHIVHFITYAQPIRLDVFNENVFYHEVRFVEYPLFDYPPLESAMVSKLVDVIRYEQLDILHVHYAIPHASVAYMAKQVLASFGINIPVITTLHGTDITLVGKDPTFSSVVTFSINQSDGVTAVSEHLKFETQKYFHIRRPIEVIYNFVDFERFKPQCNEVIKKRYSPDGAPILMHISNFRKVKRVNDCIKIVAQIIKTNDVQLLMVGDGPERYHAEQLTREMGLDDYIKFLGKQDAIEKLLAIADVFLLTSETESFGLAALEAMACRVPCVTTNSGGLPEVNIEGVTGYLSDVGDIESMATNCLKIIKTKSTLELFKDNSLAQAKRFSIDAIVPQYEALYLSKIKSKI